MFPETCQSHYPEFHPFFLGAFRTGMRLGNLLGLQWGDIYWYGKFCLVRRSHRRDCTGPTKTGKSRRVDLSDHLLEALRQIYLERKREALGDGSGGVVGFLFHQGGMAMEQNFIRRILKRMLAKAGIRGIRLHDIRRAYAGLLSSNGESPVYVKEQLGHSSISITVDIHGGLIPSSYRQAVNRLDEQLPATYPQPAQNERA